MRHNNECGSTRHRNIRERQCCLDSSLTDLLIALSLFLLGSVVSHFVALFVPVLVFLVDEDLLLLRNDLLAVGFKNATLWSSHFSVFSNRRIESGKEKTCGLVCWRKLF